MAQHLNWENDDAWPDFYALLETNSDADSESLRRSINMAYAKASALCDHRDLKTRFANQILSERVLPQCRRILLDSTLRRDYDRQWQLHRDGEVSAQSYHDFLAELERRSDVEWPSGRFSAEDNGFLPNVRSQAIETRAKPENGNLNQAEKISSVIVPLVVPGTRVSVEKGEKMNSRHTEIKGGVTFDQLQARPKRANSSSGRSLWVGALLGATAIGGLGAAWAGGLLGGNSKNTTAPPTAQHPSTLAAAPQSAANDHAFQSEPEIKNVPPPQAGKPGSPAGKAKMPLNTLAANSDFEGGKLGAWKASNEHAYSEMPPGMPDPRSGDYVMTLWSPQPYAVTVEQTVRKLKPGFYNFTAWIRRSGGQSVATMSVSDYGDKRREIPIPATLSWTPISIRNIKVSSGQCKLEFSTAGGGLKWIQVDAVEFSAN